MALKKRKSGGFLPALALAAPVAAGVASAANSIYDIVRKAKSKKGGAMVFKQRGEGLKKKRRK